MMVSSKIARDNKSIFNRLFTSFLVIIFFPILIFSVFTYNRLTDSVRSTYNKDNIEILSYLDKNLEIYFEEYARITFNVFLSNTIQTILKNDGDDTMQRLQNQWLFDDYAITVCSDRRDLESVYLISNSGYVYSKHPNFDSYVLNDIAEKEWYKKIKDGASSFIITVSYEEEGFIPKGKNFIHAGRLIRDLNTNKPLGVFFINLNYRTLNDLLENLENDTERNIVINDEEGHIVFDRQETNINRPFDAVYPELSEYANGREIQAKNGRVYLISLPSNKRGWTYIETVQVNTLYERINTIMFSILLAALGCFAVYIVAAFFISRRIINPWVYETRLKEMDSEFKALQSRINPHFLYNTLESINCLAQIKNETEISEMIRGLARMFRYTGDTHKMITLKDEINHVKDYFLLQALRYEDKFEIHYDVPDILLRFRVLKLMLQPLVENAIHHGIEKAPGKGRIQISAARDQDTLIEVKDNGKGIETEKLHEINRIISSTIGDLSALDEKSNSIGIYNIHLRLKLFYGDEYGLKLASVPDGGTTVTIRIPGPVTG
jgi:two-component system sensor histidine kinase YesM